VEEAAVAGVVPRVPEEQAVEAEVLVLPRVVPAAGAGVEEEEAAEEEAPRPLAGAAVRLLRLHLQSAPRRN